MTIPLNQQHCVPCEGGTQPLPEAEENTYLTTVQNWQIERSGIHTLWREIVATDFMAAVTLVNQIAKIAEAEGHHPNLYLHGYKKLKIELTTHAIKGLSTNDFIMAAKINELLNNS